MGATATQLRVPAETALLRRIALSFDAVMARVEAAGRHRVAAIVGVFIFSLLLRLAGALVLPHPVAGVDDEFCNLLAGDTFASGRLANPQHPMWPFFESLHVLVHPVYASKYPPAQGVFLALGQKVFGDPAAGVYLSVALLGAAICWALQGWVSPGWALLGGVFTALTFGPGHYWTETYWGGAVAAFGGALLIGSFARRRARLWPAGFSLGALFLLNSRPFEGGVLVACFGVAAMIDPARRRRLASLLVYGAGVIALMALYNWRVTGHAWLMPYALYQSEYGPAPTLWILPAKLAPAYGYPDLERVFRHFLGEWEMIRAWSWPRRTQMLLMRLVLVLAWGVGPGALMPVLFAPLVRASRQMKLLAAVAAVSAIAALLDVSLFVHYVAPLISVLIVLSFVVLCRLSRMRGTDPFAAKAISAVLLTAMLAWPVIQMARALTGSDVTLYRPQSRMDRYNIEQQITNTPGRHVIVVRYGRNRDFEWVYNGATIDAQRVIWAHDLGDDRDRALMNYYPGRRFWRVLVDTPRTTVTPLR